MLHKLDITKRSKESQAMLNSLQRNVVGQEDAKKILVDIVENYQAGFTNPGRPAGNALFLGPTGCGKTLVVEAMCRGLFGDSRACLKIDASEFQFGHEISKLVGSPPAYLGHRETSPMLTQEALEQFHTPKLKLSVLLIDEIEKSSDALWNLLLGILDKATLTLGDNRRVDFSKVIILMTSNLGSSQMEALAEGGMGFNTPKFSYEYLGTKLETVAKDAAKKKFSPEFFNRLNYVSVFKTLDEQQMKDVLDIELGHMQIRLLLNAKVKFFWTVLPKAKGMLIKEGFSKQYGARSLNRVIEQRIITPLARLVASGQILENDNVLINEVGNAEFEFLLEERD